VDQLTIETYTMAASDFAAEWRAQPVPTDMYKLLRQFFVPGGKTADIGCGAGRDVAWLNDNGFPTVGYDASRGLLDQAVAFFPHLEFKRAVLPKLDEIEDGTFDNVLCETVIMHLPPVQIGDACVRLLDILKPGGVLYLTWRVSEGNNLRDQSGRLYSAFRVSLVADHLRNATILLNDEAFNQSSGKRVHRIVAKRC
jgi:SAM-dependent methyltransferase